MEEMNLSQIQQQIDLQVGERLKQIKQKLISNLDKIGGHGQEDVRQVSRKIWKETAIENIFQDMFYNDGYLMNTEDWSIGVAEYIALNEGIKMTDAHWEVVNIMREYYEKYKICLSGGILFKNIAKRLGPHKGNSKYLYELFPNDSRFFGRQAWKIAGLPAPPHWPPGLI